MISIYNQLLDQLPNEYEGYLIRTDFRIGIQIQLCAADKDLSEYEKVAIILNLLYGAGIPPFETAMKGVHWFMSCGNPPEKMTADNEQEVFSFEVDAARFYSAFHRVYHIDLSRTNMHWFEFCALLSDLEGSTLSNIIGYRTADLSKLQGEERAAYAEMKRRFALTTYSEEEQEAINNFLTQWNEPKETQP